MDIVNLHVYIKETTIFTSTLGNINTYTAYVALWLIYIVIMIFDKKKQAAGDETKTVPVRVWCGLLAACALIVCCLMYDANVAGNAKRYASWIAETLGADLIERSFITSDRKVTGVVSGDMDMERLENFADTQSNVVSDSLNLTSAIHFPHERSPPKNGTAPKRHCKYPLRMFSFFRGENSQREYTSVAAVSGLFSVNHNWSRRNKDRSRSMTSCVVNISWGPLYLLTDPASFLPDVW